MAICASKAMNNATLVCSAPKTMTLVVIKTVNCVAIRAPSVVIRIHRVVKIAST